MSLLKKGLYLTTGIAVVSARAVQKTAEKLIEEGEKYYEGKSNPIDQVKEQASTLTRKGEETLQKARKRFFELLGVTPVDQVEEIEKRVRKLEQQLVTDAPGTNS